MSKCVPLLRLVHATSEDVNVVICVGTLHLFQSLILQLIGVRQNLAKRDCDLGHWLRPREICVLLLGLGQGLVQRHEFGVPAAQSARDSALAARLKKRAAGLARDRRVQAVCTAEGRYGRLA